MTVTYMEYTHTANAIGVFLKVLRIWKGSLIKGVWRDLMLFIAMYTFLSILYRCILTYDEKLQHDFEVLCCFCARFSVRIPLSFLLGFYVTQVVSRWWQQWNALAWPDSLALELTTYLNDRTLRRCIVRWACLSNVLVLRSISSKVAKRFPTLEHLVEANLLTVKEMDMLDSLLEKTDGRHDISWAPIHWAHEAVRQARLDGIITGDLFMSNLHSRLLGISNNNWKLYCYGWINIPLVYTQLVSIAVYSYFTAALFGRQYLHPQKYIKYGDEVIKSPTNENIPGYTFNLVGYDDNIHDMYIPVFTLLEFLFYFGWMKVAESLINPFGEDDDDFETNYIIDRNLKISYLMVERDVVEPEDTFCEYSLPPNVLPHTASSAEYKDTGPQMPTDKVVIDEDDMTIVNDDGESLIGGSQTGNLPRLMIERAGTLLTRRASTNSGLSNRKRLDMISSRGNSRSLSIRTIPTRANSVGSGLSNIHLQSCGLPSRDEKLDVVPECKEKEGMINVGSDIKEENIKNDIKNEESAVKYMSQLSEPAETPGRG